MFKAIVNKPNVLSGFSPFPGSQAVLNVVGMGLSTPMSLFRNNVNATSISIDRRVLAVDVPVAGLTANEELKAFLVTSNNGTYPVLITGVINNDIILSEPLSREVEISPTSPCEVYFPLYTYALTPLVKGLYTYSIEYTNALDGNTEVEKGLIKVVTRPFRTGLNHQKLLEIFPSLTQLLQRAQGDYNSQISQSLDLVILKVRALLSGGNSGLDEDSILNPESLMTAHAYYAAALIYEGLTEWEQANNLRAQGDVYFDLACQSLSIDYNGDGEVSDNEALKKLKGGRASDVGGNFPPLSSDRWGFQPTRNLKH